MVERENNSTIVLCSPHGHTHAHMHTHHLSLKYVPRTAVPRWAGSPELQHIKQSWRLPHFRPLVQGLQPPSSGPFASLRGESLSLLLFFLRPLSTSTQRSLPCSYKGTQGTESNPGTSRIQRYAYPGWLRDALLAYTEPYFQMGEHKSLNIQAKAAHHRDRGQQAQPAILLPSLPGEN